LNSILAIPSSHPAQHEIVLKPTLDSDDWRRFSVILWQAAPQTGRQYSLISFHELTAATSHRLHQHHFESLLLELLDSQSRELERAGKRVAGTIPASAGEIMADFTAALQELREIADYLREAHRTLRKPAGSQPVDLIPIVRDLLHTYRKSLRDAQVQTITLLPRSLRVLMNGHDLSFALASLFDAAHSLVSRKTQFRLQAGAQGDAAYVELILPHTVLNERDLQLLRHFPVEPAAANKAAIQHRLWKIQVAVCREIAHKHHDRLSVESNDHDGTTFRLSLTAANPRRSAAFVHSKA
jgi:signal transduction histidine kinase